LGCHAFFFHLIVPDHSTFGRAGDVTRGSASIEKANLAKGSSVHADR
jgi:hypothetical protein